MSPCWYPSKELRYGAGPTYNDLVFHGYGEVRIVHDRERLRGLVARFARAASKQTGQALSEQCDRDSAAIAQWVKGKSPPS